MSQVILSGEQILNAKDVRTELIQVPEWGGSVYVRVLTGGERDNFEAQIRRSKDGVPDDIRARWAALIISDQDGNRLFSDKQVEKLKQKSASALDRILSAGQRLNGMTNEDIEELEKNSESDQSDDSGSHCL